MTSRPVKSQESNPPGPNGSAASGYVPCGIAMQVWAMLSLGALSVLWIRAGNRRRDRWGMAHAVDCLLWHAMSLCAAMILGGLTKFSVFVTYMMIGVRGERLARLLWLGYIEAVSVVLYLVLQLVVLLQLRRAVRSRAPFRFPITIPPFRNEIVKGVGYNWIGPELRREQQSRVGSSDDGA